MRFVSCTNPKKFLLVPNGAKFNAGMKIPSDHVHVGELHANISRKKPSYRQANWSRAFPCDHTEKMGYSAPKQITSSAMKQVNSLKVSPVTRF